MDIEISRPAKSSYFDTFFGTRGYRVVLNGLSDDEKKVVNQHLDKMGTISTQVIEYVAREFTANAALKTRAQRLAARGESNPKRAGEGRFHLKRPKGWKPSCL